MGHSFILAVESILVAIAFLWLWRMDRSPKLRSRYYPGFFIVGWILLDSHPSHRDLLIGLAAGALLAVPAILATKGWLQRHIKGTTFYYDADRNIVWTVLAVGCGVVES